MDATSGGGFLKEHIKFSLPLQSSVMGYTLQKPGSGSCSSSIAWSHLHWSGRLSNDSLLKISSKSCRDSGMQSQKDACLEFLVNTSASHCKTVLNALTGVVILVQNHWISRHGSVQLQHVVPFAHTLHLAHTCHSTWGSMTFKPPWFAS